MSTHRRDVLMSLKQGEQAALEVRTWRDTYLSDVPKHSHDPTYVYTEATAMLDVIEAAVMTMADVACAMADDVDEEVWGTLAEELCSAQAALEVLLEDTLRLRCLRLHPSIATSPVLAVRAWAAVVVDEGAGELPASTLHLATILSDIVSVVDHASRPESDGRDLFQVQLFDIARLLDTAARTQVVRCDDDALVPVLVGATCCEAALCLRTDGVEDIFLCIPASTDEQIGQGIRMRLCPQHQRTHLT